MILLMILPLLMILRKSLPAAITGDSKRPLNQ